MTPVTPAFPTVGRDPVPARSPAALPVHCAMVALDIAAFVSRRRNDVQAHLRQVLYKIAEESCHVVGVPWEHCHIEDRGDGFLLIAPAAVGADALLDQLAVHLRAGLRHHNKLASADARFGVRMAVHAGYVQLDSHGASGNAVLHLFRLLDSPEFKEARTEQWNEKVR